MSSSSILRLLDLAGGSHTVRTVVDVGANDGSDSLPLAAKFPSIRFVAVEPTPALAYALRQASARLANYTVVECAVGLHEGEAGFNIRENSEHNSLADIRADDVVRVGLRRETYDVDETARVRVKRLETVCKEEDVDAIDVLHIDAQGSDLEVLMSAGPLLRTVRAGVVEVPSRLRLYGNSAPREGFIRYLRETGFRVVDLRLNDSGNFEQNLFFAPASNAAFEMLHRIRARVLVAREHARYELRRIGECGARLRWWVRTGRSRHELAEAIPEGAVLVLVDDEQLGEKLTAERRCRPFLEQDGAYWGPPADDDEAIAELERLRARGAHFIAFAWPAFWWLDYYEGFAEYLRSRHRCVMENERLIVFDLQT